MEQANNSWTPVEIPLEWYSRETEIGIPQLEAGVSVRQQIESLAESILADMRRRLDLYDNARPVPNSLKVRLVLRTEVLAAKFPGEDAMPRDDFDAAVDHIDVNGLQWPPRLVYDAHE